MAIDFDKLDKQWEEYRQTLVPAEPKPAKPKYEYSTDNLSMLELSGGTMAGVVSMDVAENVASVAKQTTGVAPYVAEYAKGSNAYKKYMYSEEDKLQDAKVISIETGIPINALLSSDENMAMGRSVQAFTKKRMALAPEGINDFDMNEVYEKFPNLKAIVENPNMSDTDVAIAMNNVEDLTVTHDAVEAFMLGLEADKANYRIGEIGMGAFLGLHKLNDEDRAEIERLKKSIPEQKGTPNFFDDPLVAIAGGAGGQLYHMGKGIGQGLKTAAGAVAIGAMAAPVTGGASVPVAGTVAVGSLAGSMAYDMFMNSAGRQYLAYSEMKDKNGKQLLTDDEARGFAALSAGLETGVEFWNYGKVMSLFGMNMKREIMEIVAKSQGNQEMLRAGVMRFIGDKVAQAAKVGGTEAIEEGTQDILADKAVHDVIVTYAPQAIDRKYTGEEYAKGFLESSAEALPGIIGLGVLGGGISQIKSVHDFAKLQAMQNENLLGEMKLANGLQMLQALGQNAKTSKLFKKSPEVYEASVKGAVEKTDFKEVRIDTELAMQDEEGAMVFNQLVEAMGLEQEEVNAILENKADLIVPTETYVTTVQDKNVLEQYISFDEKGHSMARKKYFAQIAEETAKRMNLQSEAEQAEVIHTVIVSNFPEEGAQQDMGAACILENPSNPYQAWKRMHADTKTAIDARLGSIVKNLKEGMSRGTHVYVSDGIGHEAKRMSDNDAWYGEFYKQHKRKPNERELLDMAREIYGGGGAKYGTAGIGYENLPDEAQADIDALDRDFETLNVLEDIKDKVSQLTASEMTVTKGLSPSGYRVYQSVREQLAQGNKDVQDSARLNAILFARYADRMAENISKITGKEYTAEDYVRERIMLVPNATQVDESGYNHPITNLDLNLDKEVDVLDLDEMGNALKGKGYKDVIAYIKENSDGTQVPTADFKAMVGLPNYTDKYGRNHIVFGKPNQKRINVVARNKVLTNFFKIIFATRVVEISSNKKITQGNLTKAQKRKNEVERFYRLFAPVKLNNKLYTILITAEDYNRIVEIDAQEISLYEITTKEIKGIRPSATLNVKGTIPSKVSIRDMLRGVKDVDGNPYINPDGSGNFAVLPNQTAYHGSPHKFDTFDQTADEKSRKQKQLELLLATNPMTDDYHTGIRTVDDILDAEDVLGDGFEEIYPDFTEDMAQKAMSKGKIKIYSSKPIKAGAFVSPSKMCAEDYAGGGKVYSKTVSVNDVAWIDSSEGEYAPIKDEVYNQSVRGQTRISGASRMVSLFEKANKSTFVHELGHVALADLKMLAEMEGAPAELVRDWQVIKDWLGVKPSQKELTREQHEQFARGFEAYLRSGEAPVRGLKSVFRKFKKWLCDIYADFVQLGGKPSVEVKAVMARMLASEQEIEAEAAMQAVESITRKKGMQFLDESTQAMYERWVNEAKEEAKEKVLKIAMKDVADNLEEGRQEIIKTMREDIENDLKQKDIFKAEALVKLSGSTDILPTIGYTEEQYNAELETYGGSLEKAVEMELAKAVEEMDSYTDVQKTIEEEAQKALQTSEYKARLVAFELEAIRRKEEAERRLDKSIDKALADIEADLNGEAKEEKKDSKEVKSLKQKIADLKYTYKWREAELRLINQMQEAQRKAERAEDKKQAEKELKETVEQFREEAKKSKEGIRLVRDSIVGQTKSYREAARKQLASMSLAQATATATWQQKERMKGLDADKLLAKGKWEEAKKAKQEQLMFGMFAAESVKIKQDVEKKIRQMKKRSDSVAKGNVKLAVDERYFYNHLLYVFGVNSRDAIKPIEWDDETSVDAMFKRYAIANEVNFYDENGVLDVPRFILGAVRSNEVYRKEVQGARKMISPLGYRGLTKEDFDELADMLTTVYTIGKNALNLRSVIDANGNSVSLEDAVQMVADGIRQNVKIAEDKDPTGMTLKSRFEEYASRAADYFRDLIKPETFFRRNDGDKDGASMQFLYDPLKRASDRELEMKAEVTKKLAVLMKNKPSDWNKKQFKLGTSTITREQLVVIALNWGTEINRMRVMDGYKVSEKEVTEVLGNLTKSDWAIVDGIWSILESYWEETVAVEERVTGVGLVKQKAVPFDINGKDGKTYRLKGGYYPIMYDPSKSTRAADLADDAQAKQQMSGNVVFGLRRGHTKKRTQESIDRKIFTELVPMSKAIDDVIHNICYREAVRDVNKIMNSKEVEQALTEAYGINVYRSLQKWVRDCWALDERKDELSKVVATLRKNMTTAVMAYRVSTAFLNVLNIFPMMEYLGKTRALSAVVEAYKNPTQSYRFVTSKSVFVAERARTMDRDVREKLATKGENVIDKYAFAMLAATDQMLAVPLWKSEYQRAFREGVEKGLAPEIIEQRAIDAGDAAVRRVFGSGDVKDLSAVQRGSEMSKMLTMYYSYMNTVLNAIEYRRGRAVDAKQWGKFANAILMWIGLNAVGDAILRSIMDDDDEEWYARFAKSLAGQAGGMFPVVREVSKVAIERIMCEKTYGIKTTSAFDGFERVDRALQSLTSDKKDWIDKGRDVSRMVGAFAGVSDTLTDGAWTLIRFADNDFDNDIGELLKALLFDKKIK